jgi:3-methyladenine DNA glycosylase AlkD
MNTADILRELQPLGKASYKKVLFNHGVREPVWGVKIEDLKKIQKRVKKDHQLALELYDTGIYDLQYLAGLIADERRMTRRDLQRWLAKANCAPLCGSVVAWVAAESEPGYELALKWIDAKDERAAHTGWTTLGSLVAIRDDAELDLLTLKALLKRIEKTIHDQPNQVRYAMNGFVIAVGSYVASLTEMALASGEKTGRVEVDMGATACQVPFAPDYIRKVQARGTIGKKRKTARC